MPNMPNPEPSQIASHPYVVLVGMDFSELADRALRVALELSALHDNAAVHVLSAVAAPSWDPNFDIAGVARPNQTEIVETALTRLQVHAEMIYQAFLARIDRHATRLPPQLFSHAIFAEPTAGLVELAAELGADLIVVGTHGREGLTRFWSGSVAESTVRHAGCPVLVVPAPIEQEEGTKIEPICPDCQQARLTSNGKRLWCSRHSERHGRRHTYHQADASSENTNFPLVFR